MKRAKKEGIKAEDIKDSSGLALLEKMRDVVETALYFSDCT